MKNIYKKNREMILYMLFGTVTLLVNIVAYYIMAKVNDNTLVDTAVALVAAVLVAYATNRTMVFKSGHHGMKAVCIEFLSFFACRAASGVMDIAIMVICVDFLHYNDMIVKIISNVFVIILNYIASKRFIFNEKNSFEK